MKIQYEEQMAGSFKGSLILTTLNKADWQIISSFPNLKSEQQNCLVELFFQHNHTTEHSPLLLFMEK